MKLSPQDYEDIGEQATRALGKGCLAVLGLGLIAGILFAIVGWLL